MHKTLHLRDLADGGREFLEFYAEEVEAKEAFASAHGLETMKFDFIAENICIVADLAMTPEEMNTGRTQTKEKLYT